MATLLLRNAYSARYLAVCFDGEAGEDQLKQAILNWPELVELGDKIDITFFLGGGLRRLCRREPSIHF